MRERTENWGCKFRTCPPICAHILAYDNNSTFRNNNREAIVLPNFVRIIIIWIIRTKSFSPPDYTREQMQLKSMRIYQLMRHLRLHARSNELAQKSCLLGVNKRLRKTRKSITNRCLQIKYWSRSVVHMHRLIYAQKKRKPIHTLEDTS